MVAICLICVSLLDFLSCQGRLTRQTSIISSLKISKHRISVFSLPILVCLKLIQFCYFREKYLKICFTAIYSSSNVKKTHDIFCCRIYYRFVLSIHPWLPKVSCQLIYLTQAVPDWSKLFSCSWSPKPPFPILTLQMTFPPLSWEEWGSLNSGSLNLKLLCIIFYPYPLPSSLKMWWP